jgi:chromosome partitioning protein
MSAAERIAVMEGELEGIDLVEILQVVGIGRQYTGVELRKADQTPLGTLFIKAGKVVTAAAGSTRGRDAFFQLFQQVGNEARKFFHVFRMETPSELPEPVGSLGNLLIEALARSKNGISQKMGPQKTASGVLPRIAAVPPVEASSKNNSDTLPPGPMSSISRPPTPPTPPSSRRTPASVSHPPASQRSAPADTGFAAPPAARRSSANDVVAREGSPSGSGSRAATPPGGASHFDGSTTRSRLRGGGGGPKHVVLGVVSPKGGSGKTTISLNLALSFARQERSVILVDGDINGDVLSAISARERALHGAIDVLQEKVRFDSALLRTVLPHFSIMPAVGEELPETAALLADHTGAWQKLLRQLSSEAEIVIVDAPAGVFGGTLQFLGSCTHVLAVLQAELIASRSFGMLERALGLLPEAQRPQVVGVVLNMLQSRHGASVRVLQEACAHLPKGWLLDTTIPRSDAFLDATEEGLPLRLLDDRNPPAVSWLFDTLASEISSRLGLEVAERKPRQLLV